MWNELFPNYTRFIPERRIFDLAERFPNHEFVTMVSVSMDMLHDIPQNFMSPIIRDDKKAHGPSGLSGHARSDCRPIRSGGQTSRAGPDRVKRRVGRVRVYRETRLSDP
jgi:hypothetical protein